MIEIAAVRMEITWAPFLLKAACKNCVVSQMQTNGYVNVTNFRYRYESVFPFKILFSSLS